MAEKEIAWVGHGDQFIINELERRIDAAIERYSDSTSFINTEEGKEEGIYKKYDLLILRVDMAGDPNYVLPGYQPFEGSARPTDLGQIANALVQRIRQTENPNRETPIIFIQTLESGPISPNYLRTQGVNEVVDLMFPLKQLASMVQKYLKQ